MSECVEKQAVGETWRDAFRTGSQSFHQEQVWEVKGSQ